MTLAPAFEIGTDKNVLNLHYTREALQTIGQYVARTFQPGSVEWQALDALWADMEAREARGDFRIERATYDGQERHDVQDVDMLRVIRTMPTKGGKAEIARRELTQRCYNLASFRHDPAGRAPAIAATLERLQKAGKVSVVNTLVTML